jgi:hypothetical protein
VLFAVGDQARVAGALGSTVVLAFAFLAADEAIRVIAGEQGYDEAVAGFGIGALKALTSVVIAEAILAPAIAGSVTVLGPFLAVAAVGFVIAAGLNELDRATGLTESLKAAAVANRQSDVATGMNDPMGMP